jgi:cytochrome bd-type quinol oxidase subunit 1
MTLDLARWQFALTFARSAQLSLVVLVPAIILAMFIGSELGVIEARYQPMKIAAAEAQWTICQPCSFSLIRIGGGNNDHTPTQIPRAAASRGSCRGSCSPRTRCRRPSAWPASSPA